MKRKNIFKILLGILILIFLFSFNIEDKLYIYETNNAQYINTNKVKDYILYLGIDAIDLSINVYENSNVNKGLVIHEYSVYPDNEFSTLIISGHSGNTNVSYFEKLQYVNINDEAIIYYKNNRYTYKLYHIDEINKTGYFNLDSNRPDNTLILVTCKDNFSQYIYYFKKIGI